MESLIYLVIFYLLLIDSITANLVSWGGGNKWYHHHFRTVSRYLPMAKGWTTFYLILVIFIGFLLCRFGVLSF